MIAEMPPLFALARPTLQSFTMTESATSIFYGFVTGSAEIRHV